MTAPRKRILVAPLDWGLGHATRCVPIIEYLLQQNQQVLLAGAGESLAFLRATFPELPSRSMPAYQVQYSRGKRQLAKILQQVPRLWRVIRAEHRLLAQWVAAHTIDAVISDNRYGLWHPRISTVCICHQISPLLRVRPHIAEPLVARAHGWHLDRFGAVWIPDSEEAQLAGRLAHGVSLPKQHQYIGPLSRFRAADFRPTPPPGRHWLAILSGPEPQRSMLEAEIYRQFRQLGTATMTLVRGKPGGIAPLPPQPGMTIHSFLKGEELLREIERAHIVVSRSGYSSLMDYAALGLKQLLLIPTPGQTEQEYLAHVWQAQGRAWVQSQDQLALAKLQPELAGELLVFRPGYKSFEEFVSNWLYMIS